MGRSLSTDDRGTDAAPAAAKASSGSQTLFRGLDVLEVVADGPLGLAELAVRLGLTRSTTHRLAAALVERRYLSFVPREGYSLGAKLLELGYQARQQLDIVRIARPYLEALADFSEDTVHLGVLDGSAALYLDKIPGKRRISISSRVGERHPLTTTGLGKALLLDSDEARLREQYELEAGKGKNRAALDAWLERMRQYSASGHSYDLEENEDRLRCVAGPVRGADGRIIAAISVSSAAQYMDGARMEALADKVRELCAEISRQVGWRGQGAQVAAASAAKGAGNKVAENAAAK
jgi:DNA-binding IclR family transcriptional regulator